MIFEPETVDQSTVAALAELAESFTDVVRALATGDRPRIGPRDVLLHATRCCPASGRAALIHADRGDIRVERASHDLPRRAVEIEAEVGEGPVLDVLAGTGLAVSNDLVGELRWPRFAREVLDRCGVRSVLAYAVRLADDEHAALAFVSDWPHAFDDLTIITGAILAQYCSLTALVDDLG